jgi:hypothetical protein
MAPLPAVASSQAGAQPVPGHRAAAPDEKARANSTYVACDLGTCRTYPLLADPPPAHWTGTPGAYETPPIRENAKYICGGPTAVYEVLWAPQAGRISSQQFIHDCTFDFFAPADSATIPVGSYVDLGMLEDQTAHGLVAAFKSPKSSRPSVLRLVHHAGQTFQFRAVAEGTATIQTWDKKCGVLAGKRVKSTKAKTCPVLEVTVN